MNKKLPETLTASEISKYLKALGGRLAAEGLTAELFVVGGAAIALAYDSRRVTADIDAIFHPRDAVIEHAELIANEHNLPKDWLNDAVSFYLLPIPDSAPRVVANWPGIIVSIASPKYLLAMKALVSRKSVSDLEDAAQICLHLGICDERQIEEVVKRYTGSSIFGAPELWFEDIATRATELCGRGNEE